ncbi:MAG TPA: hypothetical protein VHX64_12480 [Caulobacteraceae bacterium]|nr:hypothetical protein [Caulobacteraceae bacterium]
MVEKTWTMPRYLALLAYWAEWGPPADVLIAVDHKMGKAGKRRPRQPRAGTQRPAANGATLGQRAKSAWGTGRDLSELLMLFPGGTL